MLNHIVIMGRLTRDPELRRTASGLAVTSFSVAVDRDFGKSENGEKKTDFFDCVAWRNTAEFAAKYLTKGIMVVVTGRLEFRDWNDKEGNKRPPFAYVGNVMISEANINKIREEIDRQITEQSL